MKHLTAHLAYLSIATIALTGCGGGSSNSSTASPGDGSRTTVTGTASAPAGDLYSFQDRNALQIASDFFVSPLTAAVRGLQPVSGSTVELIEIDDAGNQVGQVLATSMTRGDGSYTLDLPDNVTLSPRLVVKIQNNSNSEIRSQVSGSQTDLSPVSEFVTSNVIENSNGLNSVTADDIQELTSKTNSFELESTQFLDGTLSKLEKTTGDYVKGSVRKLTNPAQSAVSLLGQYSIVNFQTRITDLDETDSGEVGADLTIEDADIQESQTGETTAKLASRLDAAASMYGAAQNQAQVGFSTEFDAEPALPEVPIDFGAYKSNGVLYAEVPRKAELSGQRVNVTNPRLVQFQKNKTEPFFAAISSPETLYFDTQDTEADLAVNSNVKAGNELQSELNILLPKPSNAQKSDLDGVFGRVRFRPGFIINDPVLTGENVISTFNATDELTFDADIGISVGGERSSIAGRDNSGGVFTDESDNSADPDQDPLTYTVSPDGALGVQLAPDFKAIFDEDLGLLAGGIASGQEGVSASIAFSLAVRLNASLPSLGGREYQVARSTLGFSEAGSVTLAASRLDSRIALSSNTEGQVALNYNEMVKSGSLAANVTLEQQQVDSTISLTPPAVNPTENPWRFEIPQPDGSTLEGEGYFNADGTLGIFRTMQYETDSTASQELGVMILSELPTG
jgi:hypothetical protein